jgi:hypothetical protein
MPKLSSTEQNSKAKKARSFKRLFGVCPKNTFQYLYKELSLLDKMKTKIPKDVNNAFCSIYSKKF